MSKRTAVTTACIAFVCCLILHEGCTQKKLSDVNARLSPEWVKHAVIYEINLRTFTKGEAWKVLEARMPELKSLGITVISLPPVHPIGELNRRGMLGSQDAVKDFYEVNSEFGTLEEFKSLVSTAHQQGLKIIITLVAAQAAWDSQLLMEHPEWFVHNAEGAIVAPNAESNDVALIDFNHHELRKYMMVMMKFWVREIGVDGFRCRSSDMIPTDFWEIARSELDKIKPVLLISESMIPEHHLKAFDFTCSWNMDTTIMKILNGTAPASAINDSLAAEDKQFPKGSLQLRFTVQDNMNENDPHLQKSRLSFILTFTLPGVPLLYCGDTTIDKFNESIIELRRDHPALQGGSCRNLPNSESSSLFSFLRFSGNDTVLTIVNFANRKKDADIQMPDGASLVWKDQFTDVHVEVENSHLRIPIPPLGFLIMVPSTNKETK